MFYEGRIISDGLTFAYIDSIAKGVSRESSLLVFLAMVMDWIGQVNAVVKAHNR
jgi:hypothetical protein